jgi:DAK2 domain fusion protein YloV
MSWSGIKVEETLRQRLVSRYRKVDGQALTKLASMGLTWLRTNQELVNSLNVFPVPDGDTGINMVLTMQSAWQEIAQLGERSIGKVCHAIAHGALMGARGNSGVILSQLWRGFARSLDGIPEMDAEAFVHALVEARNTAYKGVVRPVEGTILTVSKDIAGAALRCLEQGVSSTLEVLEHVVEAAADSVERTPELLPVLKEAGVVDAGGKGLFFLLEGMLRGAYRLPLDQALFALQPLSALNLERAAECIEPGQDWEIVADIRLDGELDVQTVYERLDKMGTSIQIGEGDGICRMHIHVPDNTQYEPIDYMRTLGTVTKVTIENLMEQTQSANQTTDVGSVTPNAIEPGQIASVAVAPGMGIARVFCSLGATAIVEGGQTMNPSTKEILSAFEDLPTNKIVILPNNKNIILAAKQAAGLTVKQVAVIPSVSIPQGVAAMLSIDPDGDFNHVVEAMTKGLGEVQSAELTIATRSVEIDGVQVREGQVIALLNNHLAEAGDDLEQTLINLLEKAHASEAELITLYYGRDMPAMQANQIADNLRKRWPGQEVEVVDGGQPHYHFIVSIE